jgi:signal transduction histidine kinase
MRAFLRSLISRINTLAHSIRFRLTIWAVIILALVLTVFSGIVYSNQTQVVRNNAAAQVLDDFSHLSRAYMLSWNLTNGGTPPDMSQSIGSFLGNEQVLALLDAQGQIIQQLGLSSSSNINTLISDLKKNGFVDYPFSYDLTGAGSSQSKLPRNYVMVVAPIQPVRGGPALGYLLMGELTDPRNQLGNLLLTLLLASGVILLLAMFSGYWLVARALHPVQVITRTAQDISETDLSRRLNLKVRDELGELANTFDRMLDRLQAAFARQRQFTADASHELRTPLTIIDLEADRALARRRSPEEYERALRTIKSENEFMAGLVNDLLTLARMDAGQAIMKMEELDLSDVTLDAVERLSSLARQKKVEVEMGDLPELRLAGDRQYLSQMVINLVENAIKYSTGEQRHVTVETGRSDSNQRLEAWLRVSDTGPGIAPENLPHLFDRFFRVDKARTHSAVDVEETPDGENAPTGSGLGLSIVQWIATAHGGSVAVQSEIGKGSTFTVCLPLLPVQVSPIKDNRYQIAG